MRFVATIFWIFIIVLAIIFALLNSHSVPIHFYFKAYNIYMPFLLLIVLAVGAVLGILALLPALLRAKSNIRKLKQRMRQSEQEVKNLRTIPIKDSH